MQQQSLYPLPTGVPVTHAVQHLAAMSMLRSSSAKANADAHLPTHLHLSDFAHHLAKTGSQSLRSGAETRTPVHHQSPPTTPRTLAETNQARTHVREPPVNDLSQNVTGPTGTPGPRLISQQRNLGGRAGQKVGSARPGITNPPLLTTNTPNAYFLPCSILFPGHAPPGVPPISWLAGTDRGRGVLSRPNQGRSGRQPTTKRPAMTDHASHPNPALEPHDPRQVHIMYRTVCRICSSYLQLLIVAATTQSGGSPETRRTNNQPPPQTSIHGASRSPFTYAMCPKRVNNVGRYQSPGRGLYQAELPRL